MTISNAVDPLDAVIPIEEEKPKQAQVPATAAQTANAIGQSFRDLPQYEVVTIEDEAAAARTQLDRWKGRKNITDRFAVLDIKRVHAGRRHFDEATKGPVMCRSQFRRQETKGPDGRSIFTETMVQKADCCELLGESTKKFAVPILQYRTNAKGEAQKPFGFELKVWTFSPKIFNDLQSVHKEHSLDKHDIKVTCTEETYQQVTITPCADSIIAHPKFQTAHGESLKNWLQAVQSELKREIGRDLSGEEIRKLLGEAPSSAAAVVAGPVAGATLDELLT